MSDQGKGLAGKVIQVLCIMLGIKKIRTTPYHPHANRSAKRVHQTLMRMISKLDPEPWQKWLAHIRSMIIAYNATHSLVTGYSPYFLMFGRRPRLLINLLFPTQQGWGQARTIDEYIETLYDQLKKSLQITQDSALEEALWQKRCYDWKVGAVELRQGDRILVKLDAFVGQCRKLKNQWGDTLHTVIGCVVDGIPAYVVKNDQTGKTKVLHWARLLLWFADYGEPVRMKLLIIANALPEMVLEDPHSHDVDSDDSNPVPEQVVLYGLKLTMFQAMIDTLESMTSMIAHEVHTGVPHNGTGHWLPTPQEEETDLDCLGSVAGDVLVC